MYYIPQISNNDCGFTALKMMLAIINKDRNYLFLPEQEIEKEGYSLQELIDIAKKNGLILKAYQAFNLDSFGKKKPLIVGLKNAKHVVLIKGFKKGGVKIFDPSLGVYFLNYEKFYKVWDGICLAIESFSKFACPIKERKLVSLPKKVVIATLQTLAVILAAIGIITIEPKFNVLIPIAFGIAFILVEIANLFLVNKLSNEINRKIESDIDTVSNRNYWNYYSTFEKLKSKSLSYPSIFVASILIVAIAIAILLLNGLENYVYILSSIVISLFKFVIFDPILKHKNNEISLLEKDIKNTKSKKTFIEKVKTANRKSKNYGSFYLFTKIFTLVMLFFIPAIVGSINQTYSVSYVLLYGCLTMCLTKALDDILNNDRKNNEINSLTCLYMNLTTKR